jgi:hypothetical protein
MQLEMPFVEKNIILIISKRENNLIDSNYITNYSQMSQKCNNI